MKTQLECSLRRVLFAILVGLGLWTAPAFAQTALDLVITYVEAAPLPNDVAYQVDAYVSATDGDGNPISGLGVGDFEVIEDATRVELQSVMSVGDGPVSVILVIDTSGSMVASEAGTSKIAAVRQAAASFVAALRDGDRVALLSFDTTVQRRVEVTSDLATVQSQIDLLNATPDAGTCLYDAAYEASLLAATLPQGRRAILLLTDGVDEIGGKVCSTKTIDDVIGLSSAGATRVPIFTVGVGQRIDSQALERLANLTGGRHLTAPTASQVEGVFQRIFAQMQAQYVLSYRSQSGAGEHTLIVTARHQSLSDQDSRRFLLPNLPPTVAIVRPADGEDVSRQTLIRAVVSGVGAVDRIDFLANEELVGTARTSPFEFLWTAPTNASGSVTLIAVAYDSNNAELSRDTVTVVLQVPQATPTTVSAPTPVVIILTQVVAATATPDVNGRGSGSFLPVVFGLLALIGVIGVAAVLYRRRGAEPIVVKPRHRPVIATLHLLESDTESMRGKKWEITDFPKTIGRRPTNDIVIPDEPVSREHALLEFHAGVVSIREVEGLQADGSRKRPKFGSFVDGQPIDLRPTPLRNGAKIRLGKRVIILFEHGQNHTGNEFTQDLNLAGPATMDNFATNEMPHSPHSTVAADKAIRIQGEGQPEEKTREMPVQAKADKDGTREMPYSPKRPPSSSDEKNDQTQEMPNA